MKIMGFSVVTLGFFVLMYILGARYPGAARSIGLA